LSIVTD